MQQTETYKLNIIEDGDLFSPKPLNENAKTLETALAAEETARKTEIARVDGALAAKAPQTALTAETAARQAALSALTGRVGTLEQTGLVCKFDSYTGKGTYGQSAQNRLTFDFKPLFLIVYGNDIYGGFPWVRTSQGKVKDSSMLFLTWGEKSVSWYSSSDEYSQLNAKKTYSYLVIGVPV